MTVATYSREVANVLHAGLRCGLAVTGLDAGKVYGIRVSMRHGLDDGGRPQKLAWDTAILCRNTEDVAQNLLLFEQ